MEEVRRWVSNILRVPVEEERVRKPPDGWDALSKSLVIIHSQSLDPLTEPAITFSLERPGKETG